MNRQHRLQEGAALKGIICLELMMVLNIPLMYKKETNERVTLSLYRVFTEMHFCACAQLGNDMLRPLHS